MLKKQIIIKECPYKVIGRYNFVITGDVTSSSEAVIPLRTFIHNEFPFEKIKLVFYQSPSKETIASIEHGFNQIGAQCLISTLPKYEKNAVISAIEETGLSLFILIVCMLSFFPLLHYWNKVIYKRMYVYYLCGCSSKKILILLFNITAYVYSLSFILALFIYKLSKKIFLANGYISGLNGKQIGIMFFLIILSTFIYLIRTTPSKVFIKNQ